MRTGIAVLFAIFMLASPSYSQNKASGPEAKPASKVQNAPAPEKEHFYYHSWKKNEIKACQSYSGVPNVLVCDSDDDMTWNNSFLNMISQNRRTGMTDEESYKNALAFALDHGKTYLTTFSEVPWPAPQTGLRLSVWSCSKDKNNLMSCGLGSRTTKDATGE